MSTKKYALRRMGQLPPLTDEEMEQLPRELFDDLCVS
jgi:hypothetical protein